MTSRGENENTCRMSPTPISEARGLKFGLRSITPRITWPIQGSLFSCMGIDAYFDWQTRFMKILALKTAIVAWISELTRNDPGPADRLIVAFMGMAVHPERRLVGLNDLLHVQRIDAGVRGPPLYLELGLITGALWLITTRGPLRSLPNQFSKFDAKFLCSAIE